METFSETYELFEVGEHRQQLAERRNTTTS